MRTVLISLLTFLGSWAFGASQADLLARQKAILTDAVIHGLNLEHLYDQEYPAWFRNYAMESHRYFGDKDCDVDKSAAAGVELFRMRYAAYFHQPETFSEERLQALIADHAIARNERLFATQIAFEVTGSDEYGVSLLRDFSFYGYFANFPDPRLERFFAETVAASLQGFLAKRDPGRYGDVTLYRDATAIRQLIEKQPEAEARKRMYKVLAGGLAVMDPDGSGFLHLDPCRLFEAIATTGKVDGLLPFMGTPPAFEGGNKEH